MLEVSSTHKRPAGTAQDMQKKRKETGEESELEVEKRNRQMGKRTQTSENVGEDDMIGGASGRRAVRGRHACRLFF